MKARGRPFFILSLFLASTAVAGAWGTGPFENDDALDWVWELEASTGSSAIDAALEPAANSTSYIEAPIGYYAIAAAEVLAALIGRPSKALPQEVVIWANAQSFKPPSDLLAKARVGLANIMDEDRSELAQLWTESGALHKEWRSHLIDLSERLK